MAEQVFVRLVDKAGTEQVLSANGRDSWSAEPISTAEYTALLEGMDAFRSQMLSFMEKLRRDFESCTPVARAASRRIAHR